MALQQYETDGKNIFSIDPVYVKLTAIYAYWQFIQEPSHHDDEYAKHVKCLLNEYDALPGHMRTSDVRRLALLTSCIGYAMPIVLGEMEEGGEHMQVPPLGVSSGRAQQHVRVRTDSADNADYTFPLVQSTSSLNAARQHSSVLPGPPPPGFEGEPVRSGDGAESSSSSHTAGQQQASHTIIGRQRPQKSLHAYVRNCLPGGPQRGHAAGWQTGEEGINCSTRGEV